MGLHMSHTLIEGSQGLRIYPPTKKVNPKWDAAKPTVELKGSYMGFHVCLGEGKIYDSHAKIGASVGQGGQYCMVRRVTLEYVVLKHVEGSCGALLSGWQADPSGIGKAFRPLPSQ